MSATNKVRKSAIPIALTLSHNTLQYSVLLPPPVQISYFYNRQSRWHRFPNSLTRLLLATYSKKLRNEGYKLLLYLIIHPTKLDACERCGLTSVMQWSVRSHWAIAA